MIDGPQIPADNLKQNWFYEVAQQEVAQTIPRVLTDSTRIRLDDVRTLMILCWLRGRTWEEEQQRERSALQHNGDANG